MDKKPKNKHFVQKKWRFFFLTGLWHGFGRCGSPPKKTTMKPRIEIFADDGLMRRILFHALVDLPVEVGCSSCMNLDGGSWTMADLVILLHAAPLISGGELCGRLRCRPRHQRLYVIAWQQSEQAVLGLLECGVDQYLTLPVSLHRLRAKVIHEILERA